MQITKKLETISLKGQVLVNISEVISDKIKFLCKNIAKVEWSGVLFYKVNGTIQEVGDMSIDILDILLMDKGTQTFTSYDFTGDISEFMMEKMMDDPDNWGNVKLGHIHSHNTMSVYFSGTDMDELYDNCLNHSYYLSLIVNNFMDMIAMIAFKTTIGCYVAQNEAGENYELVVELPEPKLTMLTYDCKINQPREELTVSEEFANRLTFILEKSKREAAEAEKKRLASLPVTTYGNSVYKSQHPAGGLPNPNGTPVVGGGVAGTLGATAGWGADQNRAPFDFTQGLGSEDFTTEEDSIEDLLAHPGINELFLCYLLRKGEILTEDDVDTVLESIKVDNITPEEILAHGIDNFANYYLEFFNVKDGDVVMEDMLDTLEASIETLEESEVRYPLVKPIIKGLKDFSMKIESSWRTVIFSSKA